MKLHKQNTISFYYEAASSIPVADQHSLLQITNKIPHKNTKQIIYK